jgi:protein SCO1/2/putative membrane protein
MRSLQARLAGTNARLVSISVDPEHDTPEVLAAYARRFEADPDRWWFLTGPKDAVYDLIGDRFKLSVAPADDDAIKAGSEAFSHSDRLALVDRGTVLGVYDSTDPARVDALVKRVEELSRPEPPAWAKRLPAVNASLNATCAGLLVLGWFLIRSGRWRGHAAAMIACVLVSALFLGCYLVYHYFVGSVPYRGVGPARIVYLSILLSHTLLATFGVVPLVVATLFQAWRRRFDRHARIARLTFPIWLYVSVTGVIIYLMLYQLPVPTSS